MGTDEDDSNLGWFRFRRLFKWNQSDHMFVLGWGGGGSIKLRESNWNSVDPEQLGNQLYNK